MRDDRFAGGAYPISTLFAVFQNRVLGEFTADEEDGVLPLAWIEAA